MDKSLWDQASLEVTTGPAHQHGHGGFRIDRLVVFKPAVDHFIHRPVSTDGNDLIGPSQALASQNCGMSGIFGETGVMGPCRFQFCSSSLQRFPALPLPAVGLKTAKFSISSPPRDLYDNGLAILRPSGFNLRGNQCYY